MSLLREILSRQNGPVVFVGLLTMILNRVHKGSSRKGHLASAQIDSSLRSNISSGAGMPSTGPGMCSQMHRGGASSAQCHNAQLCHVVKGQALALKPPALHQSSPPLH